MQTAGRGARLAMGIVMAVAVGCARSAPVASPTSTSEPTTSPTSTTTPPPTTITPTRTPTSATTPPRSTTAPPPTSAAPALPASAWPTVSVATVWRSPQSPRSVDAPALARPAGVRRWLSAMSLDQKRGLDGRADTQVLLGERVVVDQLSGSWAHVVVPDQPTPLDRRGYPGWVPRRQLTFSAPPSRSRQATVTTATTWLSTGGGVHLVEISFGTRLPVLAVSGGRVEVWVPGASPAWLTSGAVAVTAAGAPALPRTGADVVRTGYLFEGLPYLWAGTSGFGFDCSGFTSLVYRARGITIPRDADAQARAGSTRSRSALAAGDLVFFARNGYVHHVGIYLGVVDGSARMLQSPQTGSTVDVASLSASPFAQEYAGGRHYL